MDLPAQPLWECVVHSALLLRIVIGTWFGVVSVIWMLSFPPVLRVISTAEQVVWCELLQDVNVWFM